MPEWMSLHDTNGFHGIDRQVIADTSRLTTCDLHRELNVIMPEMRRTLLTQVCYLFNVINRCEGLFIDSVSISGSFISARVFSNKSPNHYLFIQRKLYC